jgi:pimeloyl-ACP methyl ester carboxylesterase
VAPVATAQTDLATVVADLTAHPVQLAVPGQQAPITIAVTDFLNIVIDDYLGSGPNTAVLLPEDLHAAAQGQWAQVLQKRLSLLGPPSASPTTAVPLQEITIRCSDEWTAMDPAQISRQTATPFTLLFGQEAAWQQDLCAGWPHDPGVSGTVSTPDPVVFLNGTADPVDPPANVAAATRTMPNALLVAVPGGGHGDVATACLLSDAQLFIESGKPTEQTWSACTQVLASELPTFPIGT